MLTDPLVSTETETTDGNVPALDAASTDAIITEAVDP